jgi:hypothetical protein
MRVPASTQVVPSWPIVRGRALRLEAEHLVVLGVLLVAGAAQAINMFNFPYVESDEGTYMSQGWAVIHQGQLAAYTYWYDHAPLGWIQISGWLLLTGGTHTFGPAFDSGRVLMLVVQLLSTFLVYRIARTVSGKPWVGALAAACFALSPYGIYFHRRVLLDNLAAVWLLAALQALLGRRPGLRRVWLSAFAMAVSVLSKEITIVAVPVVALLVATRAGRSTRWFAVASWLALVVSIISLYPLMAIIKGELFPAHTALGGSNPHVSLLCTLQYQASRGKNGGLVVPGSYFWQIATAWSRDDPLLVVGGSAAAIGCVAAWRRSREAALVGACVLSLWAFLGRGGEILGFYLVPLLPLLAICLALAAWMTGRLLQGLCPPGVRPLLTAMCAAVLVAACSLATWSGYLHSDLGLGADHAGLWTSRQADAQLQAEDWVRTNLPVSSRLVVDEYMWLDLHDPADGRPGFAAAHWYWKVTEDPAINQGVFRGDWRNVDYVITTPQLIHDTQSAHLGLVGPALQHSAPVISFDSGGWKVQVRRVDAALPSASVGAGSGGGSESAAGTPCMNPR